MHNRLHLGPWERQFANAASLLARRLLWICSRIAESVVGVLRKLGCPSPLQANQIQGGDYAAVFPVVQWVVTLVLKTRRALGDASRKASEAHFGRRLGRAMRSAAESGEVASLGASLSQFATDVGERYKPRRRFRRSEELWSSGTSMEALSRVQACLLEYGEKFEPGTLVGSGADDADTDGGAGGGGGGGGSSTEFDRKMKAMQRAAKEAEERRAKEAAALEAKMLGQMSETSSGHVRGTDVRRLVGLGEDGIARSRDALRAAQERLQAEADSGELLANSRVGKAQAHKRRMVKLMRAAEKEEMKQAIAEEELATAEAELQAVLTEIARLEGRLAEIQSQLAGLAERARSEGKIAEWMAIRRLMATINLLTLQEKQFKRTCRRQLTLLRAQLAMLEAEHGDEAAAAAGGAGDAAAASGPLARLRAAEIAFEEAGSKHRRLRTMLGRRKREIARLQRVLDDVPSRGELQQYERRFIELFEDINATREEIDKRFATYNFQNGERQILQQEHDLVRSIQTSFGPGMRTASTQAQFLTQTQQFVKQAQTLAAAQRAKLATSSAARDTKAAALDKMADRQRAYFRAVKQLQQLADRNEDLAARMEAAGLVLEGEASA